MNGPHLYGDGILYCCSLFVGSVLYADDRCLILAACGWPLTRPTSVMCSASNIHLPDEELRALRMWQKCIVVTARIACVKNDLMLCKRISPNKQRFMAYKLLTVWVIFFTFLNVF